MIENTLHQSRTAWLHKSIHFHNVNLFCPSWFNPKRNPRLPSSVDICDMAQHLWPVRSPLSQNSRCRLWNRSRGPVKVGTIRDCASLSSEREQRRKGEASSQTLPPVPWPQGPSSMASPQTSSEPYSSSCLLQLLKRHSHQNLDLKYKKYLNIKLQFKSHRISEHNMGEGKKEKHHKTRYQQFARSRLRRGEYFQLLDPWAWRVRTWSGMSDWAARSSTEQHRAARSMNAPLYS